MSWLQLEQQRAEASAAVAAKQQQVAEAAAQLKAIPGALGGVAAASHSWNAQPVEPVT